MIGFILVMVGGGIAVSATGGVGIAGLVVCAAGFLLIYKEHTGALK